MTETEKLLWESLAAWMTCPVCDELIHQSTLKEHVRFHNEQAKPLLAWLKSRDAQD